jgi:hypothetical protein
LVLLVLFPFRFLEAQTFDDTLSMLKVSGKYIFYKQDHQVRFVELKKIIKTDHEARRHYTRANINRIGADIFTGGAILLFSSALCEKYIEKESVDLLVVSSITSGLLLVSLRMCHAYVRHTRHAIETYNRNLRNRKLSTI